MNEQNVFNELFLYNPWTGDLINRVERARRCPAGSPAGTRPTNNTYCVTWVKGHNHLNHRIAWTMHYGDIPADLELDHINGNRVDNRQGNLRLVTRVENMRNQKKRNTNTSGVMGVSWRSDRNKWTAFICANDKQKWLGDYTDKAEAIAVRKQAETDHGYHINHGRKQ